MENSGGKGKHPARAMSFGTAARLIKFNVFVVLPDEQTQCLRVSPATGVLTVNLTERNLSLLYKKKGRGQYTKRIDRPHKCVVGVKAIKIWSALAKTSIMCCFPSEPDRLRCLEALQVIGVNVMHVDSQQFEGTEVTEDAPIVDAAVYEDELNALMSKFSDPRYAHEVMLAFESYLASEDSARDVAVISHAFFGS